jgi:CO/xanthine dehydrogenase Mo-binding subunit
VGFGLALYEKMACDAHGVMNPTLSDYRITAFAEVPRSETTSPTAV